VLSHSPSAEGTIVRISLGSDRSPGSELSIVVDGNGGTAQAPPPGAFIRVGIRMEETRLLPP
jgi:hypothetical protein